MFVDVLFVFIWGGGGNVGAASTLLTAKDFVQIQLQIITKTAPFMPCHLPGYHPDSITIAGGAARSALWLQIHADVTGLPLVVTRCVCEAHVRHACSKKHMDSTNEY